MDRGAWKATAHGVTKESDMTLWLKNNSNGSLFNWCTLSCWGSCFSLFQTTFSHNIFAYVAFFFFLIIYFELCWVFVAVLRLSLVVVSGGYPWLWCRGFSLQWFLLLWSTGSRHIGFRSCGVQGRVWGLTCSTACGIFLDQGSNPHLLHWQSDSYPLHHQGSPTLFSAAKIWE